MTAKILYPELFEKKYVYPHVLLTEAIRNENHHLWGACKDFAQEILVRESNWQWLAMRLDDFALLTTQHFIKKLHVWLWKSNFGIGSLSNSLTTIQETVKWIMNRWVSIIKNLFDKRYKYSISSSHIRSYQEI